MSALGVAADAPSAYLRTKFHGEQAAHAAEGHGLAVTSFRPSVIFGPGDSFFNRFAGLLALSPLVFPLACPRGAVRSGVRRRRGARVPGRARRRCDGGQALRAVRAAHLHVSRAGRVHRPGHRPPAADRRAGRPAVAAPGAGVRAHPRQARSAPTTTSRRRSTASARATVWSGWGSCRAAWRASCLGISATASGTPCSATCGRPPIATDCTDRKAGGGRRRVPPRRERPPGEADAQTKIQSSTAPSTSR